MNFKLFGQSGITKKSIPSASGIVLESYVQAPAPLRNNPTELVNMNKGYVYTCNKINSQTVASCKFKLYTANEMPGRKQLGDWVKTSKLQRKQNEWVKSNINDYRIKSVDTMLELVEHPFLELMANVSTKLDTFTLFEITENYLGLIGNCFWYIKKNDDGTPESIEVLPSEYVMVLLDNNNNITGYRQQVDSSGFRRDFKVDEILHFKQPAAGAFRRVSINLNSETGLYGMGSLEAVLSEAQLLESINTYERTLMDNNGRPDFVVKYLNGTLEDSQVKKLTRQWNGIFKGVRNSGKVSIMDNQFEIKELGFNPKDMQYIEGKKWLRTAISNAFGVHENFISVENANRASSETSIEQYYRFTILPKLRRIQEVINATLLPMYDDGLWLVYDDPVPENYDAKIKKETSDINLGIVSVNELRIERGLEPYPEAEYDRPKSTNKVKE